MDKTLMDANRLIDENTTEAADSLQLLIGIAESQNVCHHAPRALTEACVGIFCLILCRPGSPARVNTHVYPSRCVRLRMVLG